MPDDKKLHLPAIKRGGDVINSQKRIQPLDLSK